MSQYMLSNTENLLLVMITCLRCAVKFNESTYVSKQYTFQFSMAQSNYKYSLQEFRTCENQLIEILNFSFKITTPQDYFVLKEYMNSFEYVNSQETSQIFELLNQLIDFVLTLYESIEYSCQQIFFGCLFYSCKLKKSQQIWIETIQFLIKQLPKVQKLIQILDQNIGESIL